MNDEDDSNIDTEKIDEAALALLYLTLHNDDGVARAWKGIDWEVLNRLYEKGLILDPKNKAKSVAVTEVGKEKAKELFTKLFTNIKY